MKKFIKLILLFQIFGGVMVNAQTQTGINTTMPTSTLQVNGSFALPVKSLTLSESPYTITKNDYKLLIKTNVGDKDVILNLPNPTTCAGRIYVIQNMNGAASSAQQGINGVQFQNYPISIGRNLVSAAGITLLTSVTTQVSKGASIFYLGGSAIVLQSDGTVWTGITQ